MVSLINKQTGGQATQLVIAAFLKYIIRGPSLQVNPKFGIIL